MVFGVPAHTRVIDADPTPCGRLDADEPATEPKRFRIPRARVGARDIACNVREVPFDRADADCLEVDESRRLGDDDDVRIVWRAVEHSPARPLQLQRSKE